MKDADSTAGAPGERRTYYLAAAAWHSDTSGASAPEARTAWRVAGVAAVITALNGVALA